MNNNPPKSKISTPDEAKTTTTIPLVRHSIKELHSYEITEEELTSLKESAFIKSFYTCGLSVSLTALFSFVGCFLIGDITEPIKIAIILMIIIVSIGFSLIFGILLYRSKDNLDKLITKIKAR